MTPVELPVPWPGMQHATSASVALTPALRTCLQEASRDDNVKAAELLGDDGYRCRIQMQPHRLLRCSGMHRSMPRSHLEVQQYTVLVPSAARLGLRCRPLQAETLVHDHHQTGISHACETGTGHPGNAFRQRHAYVYTARTCGC